MDDFNQPPETVYSGDWPQTGVIYQTIPSTRLPGSEPQYCMPTGERMKNGKHVVRLIDPNDRGQSRTYRVKRVGVDAQIEWKGTWHRSTVVPARIHASLVRSEP